MIYATIYRLCGFVITNVRNHINRSGVALSPSQGVALRSNRLGNRSPEGAKSAGKYNDFAPSGLKSNCIFGNRADALSC